ncbi:MAG: hypothetical protein JNN15_06010 [Blastocatellia bacterium]|nr:hypothetical protein [Blastocatellia bacterium]
MNKIEIKSELLPERCEICHQADCFEPKTGHCSRCHSIIDAEMLRRAELLRQGFVNPQAQGKDFNSVAGRLGWFKVVTMIPMVSFSAYIWGITFSEGYGKWPITNPLLAVIVLLLFLSCPLLAIFECPYLLNKAFPAIESETWLYILQGFVLLLLVLGLLV